MLFTKKTVNKFVRFLFILSICCFYLTSCKKENKESTNSTTKGITEKELTEINSYVQRIWFLFLQEELYINTSGGIDSSITKSASGLEDSQIRFSINESDNTKAYGLDEPQGEKLSRLLPGIGYWALSNNGSSISFTKTSYWDEGGEGGTYTILYNPDAPLPFPYPKSLSLEQIKSLPGGRKVQRRIILGSW